MLNLLVVMGVIVGGAAWAEPLSRSASQATFAIQGESEEALYDLNYPQGVELRDLLKAYSVWAKKNLLVPNDLRGKAEILCTNKVTLSEAYQIILSVLAKDNFTTLESGSVTKVVKLTDAKLSPVVTLKQDQDIPHLEKVATKVFLLQHVSTTQMREYLARVMDTAGLTSFETSKLLIVTDTLLQIKKIEKLIQLLDASTSKGALVAIDLKWKGAKELHGQIVGLLDTDPQWGAYFKSGKGKLILDESANKIFVFGSNAFISMAKEMILALDREPESNQDTSGNVRVLPLNFTEAPKMASFLSSIRSKPTEHGAKDEDANFKILSDDATNSLIVSGTPKSFDQINRIVRRLDEKKPMVFVEVDVLDLQVDNGFQFGTSHFNAAGIESSRVITGWQSSNVAPVATAGTLAKQDKSLAIPNQIVNAFAQDLTIGILTGQVVRVGGIEFAPSAMIKMVKTDAYTKVLSNPYLLTLHNQEAMVSIGERLYYKSDKFDPVSMTNRSNITNIDADINLSVKPSVNNGTYIKLAVNLDTSLIVELTEEGLPVLGKRKLKNEIILKSGQTAFIAGLKNHQLMEANQKYPFFGDLPIFGILFNNYRKTYMSSNLIVLMTPYTIYGQNDFKAIYEKHIKDQDDIKFSKALKFTE